MRTLYGTARAKASYEMHLKNGSVWYLDSDGGVLWDGDRSMGWESPHSTWRIIGFSTRHHSRDVISLADSPVANLGQGWIHDLDHGAHRLWGAPSDRKVSKVYRIR